MERSAPVPENASGAPSSVGVNAKFSPPSAGSAARCRVRDMQQ